MIYINNINPVFFSIGNFSFHYYSLPYIAGLFLMPYFVNKNYLKSKEMSEKLSTYLVVFVILFARIFYALFYNFLYYKSNPMKIFAIWEGGMSFHGGFFGVIIAVFIFAKKYQKNAMKIFDEMSAPAAFCLFLGRLMNFVNGELFGKPTNQKWGVVFERLDPDLLLRHPSQIYEAFFEGLFLCLILIFIKRKNFFKANGMIGVCFVCGYSFFRFFIEFFREPDYQIGYLFFNISVGQILCVSMFVFGVVSGKILKNSLTYKKSDK